MSIMPIIQPNTNTIIKKTDLLSLTLPELQQWLVDKAKTEGWVGEQTTR